MKKASGHPRVFRKRLDHLLLSQLWICVTTSAEFAQYWQQGGVSASAVTHTQCEDKTFGQWPDVKKGSKEAAFLTEIFQEVQRLDSYFATLMKPPSNCLRHLEYRLSEEEKVNAIMSPVLCQQ